ncbi:protein LEKR1 isoform X2 [Neoarius graeffei]|nr:protein LEKR1 isoform X2 [Neoarius graeffei]
MRESLGEELRMCTPSHPLPVEIQQMEQEETTCHYCGVSYLILHEFQRLQEHLKEVERELERARRSVEEERENREQLQCSQGQVEELRAANQLYQDRVKALMLQVSQADISLVDLKADSERTRAELDSELERSLQLRSVCERQRVLLRDAGPVLRCAAAELHGVKKELSLLSRDWNTKTELILQHCSTAQTERVVLQQEVRRAEQEAAERRREVRETLERLRTSQLETQTLRNRIQNQQEALKQEVESLQEELQKSHHEVETLLESKRKEEEGRRSRLQQQCDEQSATILSLSRDLREKEASWLSCQQQCESLQQQLLTWKRKEAEMRRELEGALREGQKTRDEREALKLAQREEMQKMEDMFWKRLQREEEQRSKWKRDAALELDIERQKNKQLIHKYQTEYQQLQDKVPTLVQSALQDLKEEVSGLEVQLREGEEELMRVREREERLLREVEQLQHKLQEHQQEAQELQREHRDLQHLRQENSALHEENCLLQETVRRECEERAELTAALSLAREQLLGVRHTAVNSSIPHSSASASLPSLSAGRSRDAVTGGRSTASWHGNSRQALPTLPRLTTETRHRISTLTRRKDKRSC